MAQVHHLRSQRRGEFIPPVATMKLYKELGPTAAAKALGTSTTRLYNARRKGEVSATLERAAEGILQNQPSASNGAAKLHTVKEAEPVLMLLEAPPDKARIIERLCLALGAKFVEA